MANLWVIRADFGKYTDHFTNGGYTAIGWIGNRDLSDVQDRKALLPIYKKAHPFDKSNYVIGQQIGQIARFLFEIKAGDYVITPPENTEWLHYGEVLSNPSYFYSDTNDGCPYRHRRRVEWAKECFRRSQFSVPFQNTIRSSLTVFKVSHRNEFFNAIRRSDLVTERRNRREDSYRVVLDQILELDATEFEVLVGHLLAAIGFEGTEVVGKTGDGGVDVIGDLNASNLAKVKIFVQAKRHKLGSKVSANTVKQLRQSIPFGGQGAFITTAGYQAKATEIATADGFARIGLINGPQLVDLLIEYWSNIPEEFQERLGLKPGLVRR